MAKNKKVLSVLTAAAVVINSLAVEGLTVVSSAEVARITDCNKDTDGDGVADLNLDIDNDGYADINIDTNEDNVADINIDDDGDNSADRNIDVDNDYVADKNIDTDLDGTIDKLNKPVTPTVVTSPTSITVTPIFSDAKATSGFKVSLYSGVTVDGAGGYAGTLVGETQTLQAGQAYTFTGLTEGESYGIVIQHAATATYPEDSAGLLVMATAQLPKLPAPTITTNRTSATECEVILGTTANATSDYTMQISTDPTFVQNMTEKAYSRTYSKMTWQSLIPGTTYYLRARANAVDDMYSASDWETTSFTMPAAGEAFTAPVIGEVNVDGTTVVANWGAVDGATNGYELEYTTNPSFDMGSATVDIAAGKNYATFSNLDESTPYLFRVRVKATDAKQASEWSETKTFTTGTNANRLAQPEIEAEALSTTSAKVTLVSAVQTADRYTYQIATNADMTEGFQEISDQTALSYTFENLTPNTTYYFRVRATDSTGSHTPSEWSEKKTVVTNGIMALTKPVVTLTQKSNTEITAAWDAVEGTGRYYLRYDTDGTFTNPQFIYVNGTSYDMVGLTTGQTYYVQVKAVDNAAAPDSGFSETKHLTLSADTAPTTLPAVTATMEYPEGVPFLNLTDPLGEDVLGKQVFCEISTDPTFSTVLRTETGIANSCSCWAASLEDGITYYARARWRDRTTEEVLSAWSNTVGFLKTAPETAWIGAGQWSVVSDDTGAYVMINSEGYDADTYRVQAATDDAFTNPVEFTGNGVGKINMTGLTAGTKYYVRLRAEDSTGAHSDGEWSAAREITTNGSEPIVGNIVTGLQAVTPSSTSAAFTWDAFDGATKYQVEVRKDGEVLMGNDSVEGTTWTATGLTPSTTYTVAVRPYTTSGYGSYSTPVQFTTPAESGALTKFAAPVMGTAHADSFSQITFNWIATNAPAGYELQVAKDAAFSDLVFSKSLGSAFTTYAVTGLTANTAYYARIRVAYKAGVGEASDWSNIATATTENGSTALPYAGTVTDIILSGTGSDTISATVYGKTAAYHVSATVEVSTTPDFETIVGTKTGEARWSDGTFETKYSVGGLSPNTTYYVRARLNGNAVDTETTNWFVAPHTVTTQGATKEATLQPTLKVGVTDLWVTVPKSSTAGWHLDIATDADFSTIVSSTDVDQKYTTLINNASGSSKITENTHYYVRVKNLAHDSAHTDSDWTYADATTYTVATLPKNIAPSKIIVDQTSITTSSFKVEVRNPDGVDYENGCRIEVATDPDFANIVCTKVETTKQYGSAAWWSTTLDNMSAGEEYHVRAMNLGDGTFTSDSPWYVLATTVQTKSLPQVQPTTISDVVVNGKNVTLTWVLSTEANSGYEIQYATNAEFKLPTSVTVKNANTKTLTLDPETQYYFRLRVLGVKDSTSNSNWVTTQAKTEKASVTKLDPVTINKDSITTTDKTITFSWSGSTQANNGYTVSLSDGQKVNQSYTTNGTSYTFTGLDPSTTYVLSVRVNGVVGSTEDSLASNATATTQAAQTSNLEKLATPTFQNFEVLQSSAVIKWNPSSSNKSNGYTIQITGANTNTQTFTTNNTQYAVNGLTPNTTYTVALKVNGVEGISSDSNWATAEFTTLSSDRTLKLNSPRVKDSEVKATKATIWWEQVTNADNYTMEIAEDSAFTVNRSTLVNGRNVNSYTISGLKKETTYYIRVRANGSGVYEASEWTTFSFTTLLKDALTVLKAPTFEDVLPDAETCYMSWSKVTGATGYTLEVATDSAFTQNVSKVVNNQSINSVTISELEKGMTYYIRVKSVGDDKVNTDSEWNNYWFTTFEQTSLEPAKPPILTIQAIFGGAQFKTNASKDVTVRYEICADDKFQKDVIAGNINTLDWTTVTGLKNNTKYYIRVKSLGEKGKTSQSSWTVQSFTTSKSYTTTLKATPTSQKTLIMEWTAIKGADHYIVTLYDSKKNAIFEQYTPYTTTETAELELGTYYFTVQPVASPDGAKEFLGTVFTSANYNIATGVIDSRSPIAQLQVNIDLNNDGRADLNIDTNNDGIADLNIDSDGDYKADINIDTTRDKKPNLNIDLDNDLIPDVNVDTNNDNRPDRHLSTGNMQTTTVNLDWNEDGIADLNIDTNNDRRPDIELDTDGDGKADVNLDTNGDGKADTSVDINGDYIADINVDTNGDRVADIDIDTDGDNKPDINLDTNKNGIPDVNVDTTGDGKPNLNIDTNGDGVADLNLDTNGDGIADANIDTNNDGKPDANIVTVKPNYKALNLDLDYDGKPDFNIDTNNDGKPDLNIDTDGNGIADLNIDTDGDGKPNLNIDVDNDGKADINIDTNNDGKADVNIDTTGDNKPDTNVDINGDLIPDVNIKSDVSEYKINVDTDGDGKPDLNIDYTGDGRPDVNIDTNNDGKPDLNIDTNNDGWEDLNIDTNSDGKAEINIDTNNDGVADLNIDTNNDRRADVNIDTNGDGKPDVNIDTDGDGKADLMIDADGDGKADTNLDKDGDGKIDEDSPILDPESGDVLDPDDIEDIEPEEGSIAEELTVNTEFAPNLKYQIKGSNSKTLAYEVVDGNATVTKNGLVSIKSTGTVKVKVTDIETHASEVVTIKVTKGASSVEFPNDVSGKGTITVHEGDTFTLFQNIKSDGKVQILVEDQSILQLDSSGNAKALKTGTTTVTFTLPTTDNYIGGTKSVTVQVVAKGVDADDVALPPKKDGDDDGAQLVDDGGTSGGNGGNGGGNGNGNGAGAGDVNPATGVGLPLMSMGLFGALAALFSRKKNK